MKLEGMNNTRDLGYIDGVKEHKLIRSPHLMNITEKDKEILVNEYQLKTIIDLRTDTEVIQKPDQTIAGVTYLHMPVFDEEAAGITHEKKKTTQSTPDMKKLYPTMIHDGQLENFSKIIKTIIQETQNGAVIFHCTEGKDRTGMTAMILLSLLGIDYDTILKDYLETNKVNESKALKYKEMVLSKTHDQVLADNMYKTFIADEEYLNAAYHDILNNYGTMDNFFIQGLHLDTSEIEQFKRNCSE